MFDEQSLIETLFSLKDEKYRNFHASLMPTVSKDTVIGVRVPHLRKLAAELRKDTYAEEFLNSLPHRYYEENNLHALLISSEKDYGKTVLLLNSFLPYINNWATCDIISPKAFSKSPDELAPLAVSWANSSETYTTRFGIEMLMKYFLIDKYLKRYSDCVAEVKHDDYYVKMMQAWYFATALSYRYSDILPYLQKGVMEKRVHNKTIQKAVESYRITDEQKAQLRALRRR